MERPGRSIEPCKGDLLGASHAGVFPKSDYPTLGTKLGAPCVSYGMAGASNNLRMLLLGPIAAIRRPVLTSSRHKSVAAARPAREQASAELQRLQR